ncbi:Cache 3/Cache 2 fusion domain-containing protein [Zoogloea sp. LCSB751]|uniref:methyl-accepting chemotaxis protein n=1 Tax=Zoogloea sp. LCSB751 TaxID=1965277 RepID=UPI0009A550F9|nr:Cache 3/Cache 2 fusion domain-containing protein [Zoogloea sp. LCSB751]
MLKFNRQSLVHQLSLAAALVSLVVFGALIAFTTYFAEDAALAKTEDELTHQVTGIVRMLELSHGNAIAHAGRGASRLKTALGTLRIGPETTKAGSYEVPVVHTGERSLNGNIALLESLRQQIDADPALLLRSGDDFVRAATLLKNKDGSSAEGSTLPRNSKESTALLAGKSYAGVVKRNGKYFISAIEPLTDSTGKVVGALSTRVDISGDMDRLFKALAEIKSGSTGYAYVLAPSDETAKSELVYHPILGGRQIGEINNPALTRIIDEQIRRKQGAMTYKWSRTPGGPETDPKMVVFETAPSWGWIVATGSFIDEFTVEARRLRNTLIALCIGGAILLAVVLYFITRNRLAPIHQVLEATRRIGHGDLTVRFPEAPADSRNELDLIARSLDTTTRQIGTLIGDVMRTGNAVRDAARAVRQGSNEVVSSTAAQSEAAAGLATAIEELAVSVTHVSDSAAVARDMTQQAQVHADEGSSRVRSVIDGMGRIAGEIDEAAVAVRQLSERSAQISNIGKLINEIAEQTNLLALNAAIEAARAGESGRGFAVVADEVRKLAERTANSTREISATVTEVQSEAQRVVTMIQGVTNGVRDGVGLATESGAMLETIRSESVRTTAAVNDIADTTRAQSTSSQDVAHGVERIAQMAAQNNQITRRTHEQTTTLEQLVADLETKVGHFRV